MIAQASLNSDVAVTSNGVPIPEPISFGFDEIIKAKAESDAEIRAEIERRLAERSLGLGHRESSVSETAESEAPNVDSVMYRYDLPGENIPAEISDLKRRKNRK